MHQKKTQFSEDFSRNQQFCSFLFSCTFLLFSPQNSNLKGFLGRFDNFVASSSPLRNFFAYICTYRFDSRCRKAIYPPPTPTNFSKCCFFSFKNWKAFTNTKLGVEQCNLLKFHLYQILCSDPTQKAWLW